MNSKSLLALCSSYVGKIDINNTYVRFESTSNIDCLNLGVDINTYICDKYITVLDLNAQFQLLGFLNTSRTLLNITYFAQFESFGYKIANWSHRNELGG